MKAKLKNCPCCGGESVIKTIPTPFMHGWIGCPVCKIYKQWNHSPKEAIEIWNRRVMPDVEEYICRWNTEKDS